MATRNYNVKFKDTWRVDFAVEVSAIDRETKQPISAICMFCLIFGYEDNHETVTRKRKRLISADQIVHFFTPPWRAFKIRDHHKTLHPTKWNEYQSLLTIEKRVYFLTKYTPLPALPPPTTNFDPFIFSQSIMQSKLKFFKPSSSIANQLERILDGNTVSSQENREVNSSPISNGKKSKESIQVEQNTPQEIAKVADTRENSLEEVQNTRRSSISSQRSEHSTPTKTPISTQENKDERITFLDKSIVEEVLVDLLHATNYTMERNTREHLKDLLRSNKHSIFQWIEKDKENNDVSGCELYKAAIPNNYYYEQVVQVLKSGLSCQQIAKIIQDRMDGPTYAITPQIVSKLILIFIGNALQSIKRGLQRAWGFTLALDGAKTSNISYLYVRVRFVVGTQKHHVHLLSIPMTVKHTTDVIFNIIKRSLDAVCPNWEYKLIGYTCDGGNHVPQVYQDLNLKFLKSAKDRYYRIWSCANELDALIQKVLASFCNERFLEILQLVSGHLRRQKALIQELKSTCPRYSTSKWTSVGKLLSWIVTNRTAIQNFFEKTRTQFEPPSEWWIGVFALHKVTVLCQKYSKELQERELLGQQKQVLERLRETISELGNVQHLANDKYSDREDLVYCGIFAMQMNSAKSLLSNLGDTYVVSIYNKLEREDPIQLRNLTRCFATMFVELVNGIFSLSQERDATNGALMSIVPPHQPHTIAQLRSYGFSSVVLSQLSRMKYTYDTQYVNELEQEFKQFKQKYQSDAGFKKLIDNTSQISSEFQDNWKLLKPSYPKLVEFCGGLATVLPEFKSDILGRGSDDIMCGNEDYLDNLAELTIEGMFHANQRRVLNQVDEIVDDLEYSAHSLNTPSYNETAHC